MAQSLPPLPQPSRRELVIGMTLLIAVGGYGLQRSQTSLLAFPVANPVAVAGREPDSSRSQRPGMLIGTDELASIDTLDDIEEHRAR